jgi:nucleotide-binding universal stress UspA family protein
MKTIVIAYDGSECSEAIFTELRHAGLPPIVNAHVVAVAELWAGTVSDPAMWAPMAADLPAMPSGQGEKTEAVRRAGALAGQGAARLRAAFPAWRVEAAGPVGSVAQVIVQRAREVSADIIFIGSHSRTAVGRFFLGSVSQKVAAEAKCSVRICRPRPSSGAAPRLLVAVDGSLASQAAVRAVAERTWPAGTVVATVVVVEPQLRAVVGVPPEFSAEWAVVGAPPEFSAEYRRQRDATLEWLEAVASAAHRQFAIPGLVPERHMLDGEPKSTLPEWEERWNADCIFVGASGLQHPDTATLGTVASALAVRAHCSVEIVLP